MNKASIRMFSFAAAAATAIALATQAPVQAADMRSTTWTVTGTDRLHTVAREYTGTKFKKTISNEKDTFAVTITFDAGGSATAGTFSITEYEAFPVIGTWSSTKENKVILTVNQAQLQADLVAEVCPASSCVLESSWLPFKATLHKNQTTMNLEWVERIKWTNPDTTFVKDRFIFTGKGPAVLVPPANSSPAGARHQHPR